MSASEKTVKEREEERTQMIEHMLSVVEEDLEEKERCNDFIESLRDQFDRTGFLSERQYEALEKFYERV